MADYNQQQRNQQHLAYLRQWSTPTIAHQVQQLVRQDLGPQQQQAALLQAALEAHLQRSGRAQ
jgi:hypothetical protein